MKNNNLRSGTVLTLITVFALIFLQSNFVYAYHGSALPQGGSVVNGNVSINYAGHHTLDVTASNNSIINWNSFNIGSKSTVDFIQPNSSSVVLNRVVGIDPSSIYGTLEANGRVFIVNPNGIFFGPNSQVNVYALTASTLDISNSDFLAGNYTFTGNGKNAYIINKGNIHVTNGGYVALLSQSINNSGVIEAQLGHVVLATGQTIAVVGLDDDNTISVDITGAVNNGVFGPDGAQITQAAIQNSGTIEADGGTILLNAKILNGIFDNAINNSGVIQANSLVNNNGNIEIVAVGGGINSTGSLNTTGAMTLTSDSAIYSLGTLNASSLIESGSTFQIGGVFNPGVADINNADGFSVFAANTDVSGSYSDTNFEVDPGIVLTETGNTSFTATTGGFIMDANSAIDGNGFNLSITAATASTLGNLNDIGSLTLNCSAPMTFTANGDITAGSLSIGSNATLETTASAASNIIVGNSNTGGIIADTKNNIVFDEYTVTTPITVTEISTNGTASGNIIVGIYSNNGGAPGTLLATSASTPVTANVQANVALSTSVTLAPGTYWIAFNSSANSVVKAQTGTTTYYYTPVTYGALPFSAPSSGSLTAFSGENETFLVGTPAAAIDIAGATSVSGTLNIASAASGIFGGLVTVNNSGIWNNSGNASIDFEGGITNNGTFTAGTADQIFNTNSQTLSGADVFSIYELTVNGITLTNDGTLTVGTDLAGTGTLEQAANAVLNIGGAFTITSLNAAASGNTVDFDGTGAQTIGGSSTSETFDNLITGGSTALSTGGSITTLNIDGNLTLGAGTSFTAPANINIGGNWLNNGAAFTAETGTVTFDGSGTQTVNSGGASFNNIVNSNTGTLLLSANGLTVGGTLTNNSGLFDANNLAVSVTGLTTISGGTYETSIGTQTFTGGLTVSGGTFTGSTGTVSAGNVTLSSGTLTAPAIFDVLGNWTDSGGTFTPGTGTVNFDGTSSQILGGGTSQTFNNLNVNTDGSLTLNDGITVGGNLVVATGTNLDGDNSVSVTTGNATFDGTVGSGTPLASLFVGGTTDIVGGSVNTGTGGQTYTGAVTLGTNSVTLTGTDIDFVSTVDSDLINSRNLTISDSGTTTFGGAVGSINPLNNLNVSAATGINIDGTVDVNGILTLKAPGVTTSNSITAGSLLLEGSGPFSLTSISNNVGTIAANIDGSLTFDNSGALTVGTVSGVDGITSSNSPVNLTALTGNLTVGTIVAGTGQVTLTSSRGSILDGGVANPSSVAGGTLTLDAVTGIGASGAPINTAGSTIDATVSGSGDLININQTGNVDLGDLTTKGGTINVNDSGTITANDIDSTDGGVASSGANITLTATDGITLIGDLNAGSAAISLNDTTTGDINQTGGTLTAGTLNVTNTVGSTTLNDTNVIPVLGSIDAAGQTFSFTDDVLALTQSGALIAAVANISNVYPTPGGTITLNNPGNQIGSIGTINEPGQTFTLVDNVPGGLTQSGIWTVGTLNLTNTASSTTLNLANVIDTLGTIDAAGQTFSLTDNVSDLTQTGVLTAAVLNLTNAGEIDLSSQNNMIGQLGTINANSGNSDFLLNNDISLGESVGGSITAKDLTLEGNGTFTLSNSTNSVQTLTAMITGGGLTYDNAGNLVLTTNGVITNGGAITISSGGILTANNVDSTDAGLTATGATISLTATDSLNVGVVNAGTAGNVFLTSNTGSILDIGSPVTTLISGNQILLDSLTGDIGGVAPSLEIDPNAVDINKGVVSLILKAPEGDIYVNTNGSFATDNLSLINIDSTGTMVLGADGGSLNVNSGIFDSITLSDLYLEATGSLTVNDAIQITPASGNPQLGLYAEGNITLANDLTAHGGDIQIDATFAGVGTGSITTNGTQSIDTSNLLLAAATGINITTNTSANSNTNISAKNTSGNIDINNTGNWTIINGTGIGLTDSAFADGLVDNSTSGTDDLTAHSTITVDAPVSTGGANLDWIATDIYFNDGVDVPLINTGTGSQTYNDPVILDADATLTGDVIDFVTTLDGGHNLTIDDSGLTTFGGAVGGTTPLTSLTVDATGTTDINGGSVKTTAAQTYNDAVTLSADATLTGDVIDFVTTLDGGHNLTIDDSGLTTFGGAVGGTTPLTSLTVDATGTTDINGGSVKTTAAQTYNDAVTLSADATLTGDVIDFVTTLDGGHNLTIDDSGLTTFGGAVGGTTPLTSLTVDATGTTDINGGSVKTTAAQTYNDAVTLSADATLTGDVIDFVTTLDGGHNLTIDDSGLTTFGGAVGGTTPLTSLTVDATGTTDINGGSVKTTAAQTYNDAVTLSADATLTGDVIDFVTTLDGGHNLTIDDSGLTTFGGAVGGTTPLTSLTVDATGTTDINGGSVKTTAAQTYNDAVTLSADATLTGDVIDFVTTLDGGHNLTIDDSGLTTFGGAVGGTTPLTSLTVDATGTTDINGGSVKTTAAQTYNDAVTLSADATLTGDVIDFVTTLDGGHNLTIDDSGLTTFGGAVGGTTPLTSLTVDATGTTDINGGSVKTTAAQTYNDAVTLSADATLTGDVIDFVTTLDGGHNLTIDDSGLTTFGGAVGGTTPLTSLTVDATGTTDINGGSVKTTAAQTYNDAVTLSADATLTGDVIDFVTTLDGGHNLTIDDSGLTTFGGAVGGTTPLTSLTVDATGTTDINGGSVKTTAAQTYNDAVTLSADATLNGDNITFKSTVNSTANDFYTLSIVDSGETTFDGAVGTGTNEALGDLTVTAPTIDINGGAVTTNASTTVPTNGEQNYNGSVILSANATLTTTGITSGDGITFNGTVDSATNTGRSLTISDSGETTFMDAVGATHKLSSLTANATASGTTDINGGSVTTTGAQTYHNPVVLSADAVLNGKNISFDSTISGDQNLTINDTGTTTFVGNVGWPGATPALTPLVNLVVNANTIAAINSVIDATGTVVLNVTGTGGVTEGANGYIIAPNLLLNGGGVLGSFTLANANNDVNTIAANIGGSLTFENSTNLTVGTVDLLPITTASAVNGITSTLGNVTLTTLDTTGTGLITLNQNVAAGPVDNVTLNSAGGVTQTFGSVTGLGLQLLGNGTFTLNDAGNDVTDIAANVDGSITYNNSALLIVYKVPLLGAGTSNITTDNGNVTLNTEGLLTIIGNITAGTGTVVLNSTGGVVEAGGNVTASNLLLQGTGTFSLLTSTNQVGTLAASIIGPLYYTNSGMLTVGSVTGSTDGGVTFTTKNGITVGNNAVDINTGNKLTLSDGSIDAGTGVITLNTTSGGINQIGGDLISTGGLLLLSNGATSAVTDTINDPDGGNTVVNIAANIKGSLSYTDSADLTVGTVKGTTNGTSTTTVNGITTDNGNATLNTSNGTLTLNDNITAGTGIITLNSIGGITQNSGVLTSDGLLLLGAGPDTLTDANIVGTIAANINGSLTYNDAGTLTVGTVGGVDGITSGGSSVTLTAADDLNLGIINAGTTGNVFLTSTTGSILDDGAASNPSSVTGNFITLDANQNIGAGTGDLSTDPVVTDSPFLTVNATNGSVYLNSTGVTINLDAPLGSATLLTNDVILDTITTLGDFTLEATSGNITINGTTDSTAGAVNLDADHGNINANPGSVVEANANSFFSTPNGTMGVQDGPLNVDIIGNLILNIGTRIGLTSGNLTGIVVAPPSNIPLLLPSNFPDPLYPPGNVFWNGVRIWPSETEFELSQANSGLLNHFVFPSAQSLALTQVNTFDPSTSSTQSGGSGLFLYHPLTDVDSGSFDQEFQLDEGAYDFIDGDILKKGAH